MFGINDLSKTDSVSDHPKYLAKSKKGVIVHNA